MLDIPADCARKLKEDRADIGLVPVAVLPELPYYELVADYCIGAVGEVNSVFLFSRKPLEEIRFIRTDNHSRTSNLLARILASRYWKIDASFGNFADEDAFVLIGDRTFGLKKEYPYVYDLAAEWIRFTGLPFVFAVWAANKPVDPVFREEFNRALEYGVTHRKELLKELPQVKGFDLEEYLMKHLSFELDARKKEGLSLFLQHVQEILLGSKENNTHICSNATGSDL
ncbi:chorismate dehydratase [Anseongella ginsenosidimutans]|uniref:Chorismate dehydratase n=2 Tax=Anseongella ginsenosidimutans TaxID=496056 RepID=A0A4R3KS14_9SPHI|nr:chorismate dehydratase [Anseongella ginsenosidimutans]